MKKIFKFAFFIFLTWLIIAMMIDSRKQSIAYENYIKENNLRSTKKTYEDFVKSTEKTTIFLW